MNADLFAQVLARATVPEHSPAFMSAMSGGDFFMINDFCFLAGGDWLMAIGYPLAPPVAPHPDFLTALQEAIAKTGARECWCIAPELPAALVPYQTNVDDFFLLPANAPVPARLRRPLAMLRGRKNPEDDSCPQYPGQSSFKPENGAAGAKLLKADITTCFGPRHRQLWAEFTARKTREELAPNVRELFARTEAVMGTPGLALLNAWDNQEHLAACWLVDFAPKRFASYIIGAHSRRHYTPHASDMLMSALLEEAAARGKEQVNLGLGVNDGIRRFKRKWGAAGLLPYRMASWQEPLINKNTLSAGNQQGASDNETFVPAALLRSFIAVRPAKPAPAAEQQPFAMLWTAEKNGRRSFVGGSAHFFRCSFERSFRRLFEGVDSILLEGRLDEESLDAVARSGNAPGPDVPRVGALLSRDEIHILARVARGPEGVLPRLLNMEAKNMPDVLFYLEQTHPWRALFSLWTAFLERRGWAHSVDLEIWRLGHELNKAVIAMESLEEQIASLESVTAERVADFFRSAPKWKCFIKRNAAAYLAGDLERMMGTSTEFPTRTERVINYRDQRFRERMRPFLEAGRCAAFVGTAHLPGLLPMLEEDGFQLRQIAPTWRHALRARMRSAS